MFGETGMISNIRSKLNPTAILIIVVVLLLLGVSVYYYTNYISKGKAYHLQTTAQQMLVLKRVLTVKEMLSF